MSSKGPPTAISVPPVGTTPADRPCLLILSGPEMGRTIELGHEAVDIGRSSECTLALKDDLVSRRHTRIKRIFALYFVTDLESANGTFVNGERVTMAQLNDGDQIRVGDSALKFVANYHEVEYSKRAFTLATVDALTGSYNKGHFNETFPKEMRHAVQRGTPLCLIVLDVDHFKRVNDTFGHPVGDLVLTRVAETIRKLLSPESVFYRVGGEEFAVVATGSDRAAGLATAEQVRGAIERIPFDHEGRRIPITVSLGVAELAPADSPDDLYQRADARLYSSKAAGRNRVS
jgi:two-component system, cell cycle response regulator